MQLLQTKLSDSTQKVYQLQLQLEKLQVQLQSTQVGYTYPLTGTTIYCIQLLITSYINAEKQYL